MRARRLAAALLGGAVLLAPGRAGAHPLGNFTINLYAGIHVAPGVVRIDYVLDMAEIPTFQAMEQLDADGDGEVSAAEGAAWSERKAAALAGGLRLTVDGEAVALAPELAAVELLPGQGGLEVLRLEATLRAPAPERGTLELHDGNYADRLGWREVTAVGVDGRAIVSSDVPAASASDRLRAYPEDLLASPLRVTGARVAWAPGVGAPAASHAAGGGAARPETDGALAGLVARPDLSFPVAIGSLLLAMAVGAAHALAPGHGKTVIAASLGATRARLRQAVGVGVAVSVMHTASVLALGGVVLAAGRAFPPERLYPWLGLVSGVLILGLGGWLLASRLRAVRASRHGHPHPHAPPLSRRGLAALAVSGGILPSPSALVVLLAAISLHRLGFGLALIAAFSVGLAGALAGVGALAIRAGEAVSRRAHGRIARAAPIGSASVILAVGIATSLRAAIQL